MPIYSAKDVKYYKYNPWTQPQIPDNGTFGGDRFAVAGAIPYTCYNGSTYINGINENSHFEFYNPEPIKVNKITITSGAPQYAQRAGYVSYSDDNITWTKSNDWTNPSNNPYEIPVTEKFAHKYWQVYFTQRGTTGNADIFSVRIDAVTFLKSTKDDYDFFELAKIKQIVNPKYIKYYKYEGEPVDKTSPVYTSQGEAEVGVNGVKIITSSNYWQITTTDLVRVARGNIITFDLGEQCLGIKTVAYNGYSYPGYWASMSISNLECSIDGQSWTRIVDSWGNRGTTINNPYEIPYPNTYRYLRFTTSTDDGGQSTGGATSFRIGYMYIPNIVEVTKNDDYDFRELHQIKEVYSKQDLVFTKGV